mmetsp:Transcript_51873/g.134031  ORF Transcript_51873/g.134031 Transcript_51873/m.134031 type:complete len:380 (+) Transcript_51873:50-1189(+)
MACDPDAPIASASRLAPLDPSVFRQPRGKGPTRHLYIANCGLGKGDTPEGVLAALHAAAPGAEVVGLHVGEQGVSYASFANPEGADLSRQGVAGATRWVVRFAETVDALPGATAPDSVESTTHIDVPGLMVIPDFVTKEEAETLLAEVDMRSWDSSIKRRVQHYGHAFDYARLALAESGAAPVELPEFCHDVAARVSELTPMPINQLTVNEYQPGVGIASHCDAHSAFEDGICGLTLGSGIVMEFRKPRPDSGGKVSVGRHDRLAPPPPEKEDGEAVVQKNVWLPARSLFILTGEARYAWQHGIAWRKTDCLTAGEVRHRSRRVSLTLRAARFAPCECAWPILCEAQNPEAHVLPSRIGAEEAEREAVAATPAAAAAAA